jgi:hypothetical protein
MQSPLGYCQCVGASKWSVGVKDQETLLFYGQSHSYLAGARMTSEEVSQSMDYLQLQVWRRLFDAGLKDRLSSTTLSLFIREHYELLLIRRRRPPVLWRTDYTCTAILFVQHAIHSFGRAIDSISYRGDRARGAVCADMSGLLIDHQALNRTKASEFLGIRYAEAPVGILRFAAQGKYIAQIGTIFEASEWVDKCQALSRGQRLIDAVGGLSIKQTAHEHLPELYRAVRIPSVEEFRRTERQSLVGRLPKAQHMN